MRSAYYETNGFDIGASRKEESITYEQDNRQVS